MNSITGRLTMLQRDTQSIKRIAFIQLDSSEGASGSIAIPLSETMYDDLARKFSEGPFAVTLQLSFDKL